MKILDQIESGIIRIVGWILILIIVTLTGCCILQVFTRYVLNDSLTWTEELARYCFIWGGILGAVLAFHEKSHARILILFDHFPKKIRFVLEAVANGLAVYMGYLMIRYGIVMTINGMNQRSPQLDIPLGWVYASVPVTGILIVLFMAFALIRYFLEKRKGGEAL